MTRGKSLYDFPIHLGIGARAVAEPQFTGMDWYDGYDQRHHDDLDEGRIVSLFRFEESWTSWRAGQDPASDVSVIKFRGFRGEPAGRRRRSTCRR